MNESRDKFQTEAQNDDDPNHVGNGFPPRLWQRSSLRHSFALRISCVLIQHVGDVLSEGLIASRRPVAHRLLVSLIARTVRPRNFTHDPFDGKETRKRAVVVSQRFPSGGIASPGSRVAQEALSVKKGIIALIRGTRSGCDPDCGARRGACARIRTPLPGGSGHHSLRYYGRGVGCFHCTGTGKGG
jgi:hypothetical protein